jgi:PAS domain S-box-containing protein
MMDFPCDSPQQNGFSLAPQPYVWEHYNRAMDRYYLMSDQTIKWVDGRTVYFKLAIDITQRKLTEKALQSSEERLRAIIEQNADGILIVDEAGIVQFTNPAAEELLAQSAASLVGKPAPFSINGDEGAAELKLTSPPRVVEMRVVSTVWENEPAQLASLRDISERRRAEERIRYQAHLLQMVSDAIISVEGEAYRIRSWNKAAEALYGWRAAEVVGKPINDVLPAHFLNDTEEEAAAYLAELGRWRGEVIHQCRDGTDLYIMASVALVTDPQNEESGMVIVAHDITGQKQLERELNAYSERLEEMVQERTAALRKAQADLVRQEKLAVLGQLAGGVAHELRNPLGAIRNAAFLLEMVVPDPDPEAAEALQILEQEVGNCNRIINSLLDFARPRPPAPVPVSMRSLLEEALAEQSIPPGVETSLTLADGACAALVDEAQMKIALSNIVLNGVQAMTQAGETAVGALTIECRIAETEEVQIIVSDTGPGVPPDLREKLFEPLYTTKAKGIGLGLALAKMLIEKNNGRIDILDNTENGAAFTIFLPRAT